MKIATSTGDFKFYLNSDTEILRELHAAGFRYVDLSMYTFTPDSVYMNDGWEREVNKLLEAADSLGMKFVQAHSQGGNPLSGVKEKDDFIVDATIRSIEICEVLGIKNTVAHPGFNVGLTKEEWFNKIKELCSDCGFTPNVKEYKQNPDAFKGHVGDVSTVIRIAITSRTNTPDLYYILQILGVDEVMRRIDDAINSYKA